MKKIIYFFFVLIIFVKVGYSKDFSLINSSDLVSKNIRTIIYNRADYFNINDLTKILKIRYIWEPFTESLELTDDVNLLKLQLKSNLAILNNKLIKLKELPMLLNGILYVPLNLLKNLKNRVLNIENNSLYYKVSSKSAIEVDDDIGKSILKYSQIKVPKVNPKNRSFKIKTIIIDPGHGGYDPGAVSYSKKVLEKDVVLSLALELKKKLDISLKNVKVILTRTTDEFLTLGKRARIANKNKGDLFISLHCNSGFKKARGFETFYFSLTEDDETDRTVRLFENSVEEKFAPKNKKLNPLEFIKTDLAQINHINESSEFADIVQKKLSEKLNTENRGVRKARFFVLKDVFMPSVLIEIGFLSNKNEEKLLNSVVYQKKIASSLSNAILQYKNKVESVYYEIKK